jgi:hypothetical protein
MRQSCPCTFLNPLEDGILPDPVESPQCALSPGSWRYRLNDPTQIVVVKKKQTERLSGDKTERKTCSHSRGLSLNEITGNREE